MTDALDQQIHETIARGKQYTLVLLWAEAGSVAEGTDLESLQQDHLRHLFTLRNSGALLLNGPVADDSDLAGVCIFADADIEAVRALAEADPAVIAGRLRADVRPWFGMPGDTI